MFALPKAAEPPLGAFSIAFFRPAFQRALMLRIGAIIVQSRRTITNIQRAVAGLLNGHSSTFPRVLSQARWSLWPLGRVLAHQVPALVPPDESVLVAVESFGSSGIIRDG